MFSCTTMYNYHIPFSSVSEAVACKMSWLTASTEFAVWLGVRLSHFVPGAGFSLSTSSTLRVRFVLKVIIKQGQRLVDQVQHEGLAVGCCSDNALYCGPTRPGKKFGRNDLMARAALTRMFL